MGFEDALADLAGPLEDMRSLYYRWEREQWEAVTIDLGSDAAAWRATAPDVRSSMRSLLEWLSVTERDIACIVVLVDAVPREEQQVFLTTQLADRARHLVFFERLGRELTGERFDERGGRDAVQDAVEELLPAAARSPSGSGANDALTKAVTLHHLVREAFYLSELTCALEFLLGGEQMGQARAGLVAVARDRCRHASFGRRFAADVISRNDRDGRVVRECLDRGLELGLASLAGLNERVAAPYREADVKRSAMDLLVRMTGPLGLGWRPRKPG
jgi:ribonucleoside-diphosphate reductase beta chain